MRWSIILPSEVGTIGSRLRSAAGRFGLISNDLMLLVARCSVGVIFWRSGQTKLDGWHLADSAVYMFQTEYRLPFIDPWMAAALTAFNETVFSIGLMIGLASRFAALILFGTTLVIEVFVYPDAWAIHGTWAVCLGLVIVRGAGVASLDYWLLRLADFSLSARRP